MRLLLLAGRRVNLAPQQLCRELLAQLREFEQGVALAEDGVVFVVGPLTEEPARVGPRLQVLTEALGRVVFGPRAIDCEVGDYEANFTDANFAVQRALFLFDRDRRALPQLWHSIRLCNYCPLLAGGALQLSFLLRRHGTTLLVASVAAESFAADGFDSVAAATLAGWAASAALDPAQLTRVLVVLGTLRVRSLSLFDCESFHFLLIAEAEFADERVLGLVREDLLRGQRERQRLHVFSYAVQGQQLRREDAWLEVEHGFVELTVHCVREWRPQPLLPCRATADRAERRAFDENSPFAALLGPQGEEGLARLLRGRSGRGSGEHREKRIGKSRRFEERTRKVRSVESLIAHSRYSLALRKLSELEHQPLEELLNSSEEEKDALQPPVSPS